jgi:hypothetical protein
MCHHAISTGERVLVIGAPVDNDRKTPGGGGRGGGRRSRAPPWPNSSRWIYQ